MAQRLRWYRMTPDQRRGALDKARELFGQGKPLDVVLSQIKLDPLDKSRVAHLAQKPSDPVKPVVPEKRRRDPASEAVKRKQETDEYLDALRAELPPAERARLLVEAAQSPNAMMRASAIKQIDQLLHASSDGSPTVPLFALPPDTRLGFAPVVSQGQADVEAERQRVIGIIQRYWMATKGKLEMKRWQECLAEVIGNE